MGNVTKKDVLNALATINFTEDVTVGDVVVTPADIKDFIENSIVQIDNRAAKAAERAAEKKQAGDELRAKIKAVIEDGPKTIAEIVEALDDEDVTSAKVVSRLTQLVKLGEAFKADTKVDSRTIKVYSTVPFTTED